MPDATSPGAEHANRGRYEETAHPGCRLLDGELRAAGNVETWASTPCQNSWALTVGSPRMPAVRRSAFAIRHPPSVCGWEPPERLCGTCGFIRCRTSEAGKCRRSRAGDEVRSASIWSVDAWCHRLDRWRWSRSGSAHVRVPPCNAPAPGADPGAWAVCSARR